MRKKLAFYLAGLVSFGCVLTAGCDDPGGAALPGAPDSQEKKVSLTVVTTYGGDDGGRGPYQAAYKAWEAATGNTVLDASGTANEEFKTKVNTDFETGSEPDVLFYFNGADSDNFVQSGKVVSIDEIRSVYPDYIANHDLSLIPVSAADGAAYAVPCYGYWELLYVNKAVLAECNVAVPDEDTTWEEFMAMCEVVKQKGFIPYAVSLHEEPHYLFEYTIYNYTGRENHLEVPTSSTSEGGQNWKNGLATITEMFGLGYFPPNTTTMTNADAWRLIYDYKAAFVIDGSWKQGNIEAEAANIDDFTVTFVPGTDIRPTTEIIVGLSSGWYITRKAWEDPEKQAAAVSFVNAMVSDEAVASYDAVGAPVTLKSGSPVSQNPSSLRLSSLDVLSKATGSVGAAQDNFTPTQRAALFADLKFIVTGEKTAEAVIDEALTK